ncbi:MULTISPECIES: hypothetical protein [unclassified Dysgonomonas]|uniref:hypothetical protein n=1 Tax=unclassified Dysgonomonas TaxID=2630389 RepID=UPI002473EBAF|nr:MULTISPECIES: hypothetical protein [unclassified Dysgonomonas]
MKAELLKELLSSKEDTLSLSASRNLDIEYKYFVKKKSLNGGYCLELKAVTHVDSIAKAKYGSLIEDRDVFSGYSYSQKIEILEELLSFQGDTAKSGKSYKINSPDLSRIYIEPFNIQIESLYTFSKMLLIGYPPILPKLTDKNEVINLNGNQTVVDEVYELYRQWLQNAIKNDFRNLTLPMSGSYYQWERQGKITSKWYIDFHKKGKNDLSYNAFEESYDYINTMLKDEIPLYFKNAVLNTEVAFNDEKFDIEKVNQKYRLLVHLAKEFSKGNLISYIGKDKDIITKHAAIFKVLTDTTLIPVDSSYFYVHTPYTYDFEDPLGQSDWSKMFVSKLLETGTGNCHSLPYLYKILADELNIPCNLAFAPNHIYIKLFSENKGWYNTELTSGTFPIDAWIIASGYVTLDAIRNGLYMDTLSNKQAVANCLIDLAQGYQHKYGKDNPEFVIKCCNKVLEYHPTNVNAILTKAEAQKHYIHSLMKAKNLKSPEALFSDENIKNMYSEMESLYIELHKSGYRRMPEEMYSEWLNLLRSEPDKYINKSLSQ